MSLDPETVLQMAANSYAEDVLPPGAVYYANEVKSGLDDARLGDFRKRIGCKRGMPDAAVLYRGRTAYIEWKRPDGGGLNKEQKDMHARLRAAGAEVYVLRSIASLRQVFLGLGVPLLFNARTAELRDEEVASKIAAERAKGAAKRKAAAEMRAAADAEMGEPSMWAAPKRAPFRKRAGKPSKRALAVAMKAQAR